METVVTEKIIEFNGSIQRMAPENGPNDIQRAYTQIQKLLDQLRQKNDNHPGYLMAWNLLSHYGKTELQDVHFYYTYVEGELPSSVAKLSYEKAFTRLKEVINTAVTVLPQN